MKKLILIGTAVVVVVVLVLVVGVSKLGPMIKHGVNTYGPTITNTEVHVGDVRVSLFSGTAELKDFSLGNPPEFKSPEALKVGAVLVDIDERSIATDTIVIERIEVLRPEITYERGKHRDNFKAILKGMKGTQPAGNGPEAQTKKTGTGKKLLIREFVVKEGKVNVAMSAAGGKSLSTDLPDIHLTNLGGGKEGATPEEVVKEMLTALYGQITSGVAMNTVNQGLKELGLGANAVKEGTKEDLGGVTDTLKGVFGGK
jgi:uncharacterized protein involved in outer membrane biogenesis